MMKRKFMKPFKWLYMDVAPILPQVYDETLSFYECIALLAKRIDYVTDSVNENFWLLATKMLSKYFRDYVEAHITYTESDKGLHLYTDGIIISGDHKYNRPVKEMQIIDEQTLIDSVLQEDEDHGKE